MLGKQIRITCLSSCLLAGTQTSSHRSMHIYIVLVLLSPIYLVPMVLDSNMLSSSFHRVVPWTNLFLKGPDSMTHACPKLFYFFCVCGTSDMSSTWAQHAFFSRGFPLYYPPVEDLKGDGNYLDVTGPVTSTLPAQRRPAHNFPRRQEHGRFF